MRHPHPRSRRAGLADIDQGAQSVEMMADGFTMNAHLRYLPERSFPIFLGQLDEIRRAKDSYRFRALALPYNYNVAIGAFDNFDGSQNVQPGTCVWGLCFAALDGAASDFDVQIYDTCSGTPFFSEPVRADFLRPTGGTDLYPVLVEPRMIVGQPNPALKVNIANRGSVAQRCQLLILTSEPCAIMGPGYENIPKLPWEYQGGIT